MHADHPTGVSTRILQHMNLLQVVALYNTPGVCRDLLDKQVHTDIDSKLGFTAFYRSAEEGHD